MAAFHWRYLHPKLRKDKKILADYKGQDYVSAVTKAWEIYDYELQVIFKGSEKVGADLVNDCLNPKNRCGKIDSLSVHESVKSALKNSIFFSRKGGLCGRESCEAPRNRYEKKKCRFF